MPVISPSDRPADNDASTAGSTAAPGLPEAKRRSWRDGLAVVGIGYSASWIVGLSVWPSNLSVTSTHAQVLAAFDAHRSAAAVQYLFTEGLPAIGIGVVSLALGRALARTGADGRARFVRTVGLLAATISLVQTVLGLLLAGSAVPSGDLNRVGLLFEAVNRLDGVKMFLLAALALGAGALVRSGALPKWLGTGVGIALAAAIAASGIGYLLLNPTMAVFAWLSLPLLLVWITGGAILLGRAAGRTRG